MSACFLSVLRCNKMRMQRVTLLRTGISLAHNSGTWCMPMERAASAGKLEVRSPVVVKIAEAISSNCSI